MQQAHQRTPPPSTAPAPPMAGARTFFGAPNPSVITPTKSTSQLKDAGGNKISPSSPGGLFGQPKSPEKNGFKAKLITAVRRVQSQNSGFMTFNRAPEHYADALAKSVEDVRRKKSEGFLPDNQQWRWLREMLDNDRFIFSAISGHFSPKFLALADKSELEQRTQTLNGLSEKEFREQMSKLARPFDTQQVP